MEPSTLHSRIFGSLRYFTSYKKRHVDTNLATKSFTYSLTCLQDMLWVDRTFGSSQTIFELTKGTLHKSELLPHTASMSKNRKKIPQSPRINPNTTDLKKTQ